MEAKIGARIETSRKKFKQNASGTQPELFYGISVTEGIFRGGPLFKIMSTATSKPTTTGKKDTRVIDGLNLVVADSYALMALTHLAHWNVEGPDFFPLHKAFQEQYENLFEAIDEVAERVRALDAYAIGGLTTLAKVAQMEEFKSPMPQKDYVAALIVAHEKVMDDATRTRDAAGESSDLQTQDLMIKRLQWHQKTLWMLKSYLKP
jgi:starvation-inducible DNA-binding protein